MPSQAKHIHIFLKKVIVHGTWVAQLVKCVCSAQVILGLSPALGSLLSGESSFPSAPPLPLLMLPLSCKNK